jgi:ribosomal protein S18 acetylase RimI-like enzyme
MDDLDQRPGERDVDHVEVRVLAESDLDWVVRIDSQRSGRVRKPYFKMKLEEAVHNTGLRISLAGLVDREPAGFLMARLYYGEFGQPEPAAVLDSIGIAKAFAGRKVARALLRQLEVNLAGLGVERLETEVDWSMIELVGFFQHAGFKPAARLCLEKLVERPR